MKCHYEQMKGRGLPQECHAAPEPHGQDLELSALPLPSDEMCGVRLLIQTVAGHQT